MTTSVSRVFYFDDEVETAPTSYDDDDDDDHQQTVLFDLSDVPLGESSPRSSSSCLSRLHTHDCLVSVLDFLSFPDMNNFSLVSKECYNVRCHKKLDQTRAGTICLGGNNNGNGNHGNKEGGVQSIVELMLKVREQEWHKTFRGNRTHLHLSGLNCLSSDIESIDEQFIKQCSPLKHVTSLDCSEIHHNNNNSCSFSSSSSNINNNNNNNSEDEDEDENLSYDDGTRNDDRNSRYSSSSSSSSSFLFRYEDYIDKGFAHGLALSLLVPNLREIDMSYLPLTSLGVAWIAENNPKLERIRWNRSLIWPINNGHDHTAYDILRACRNLKELYIDDARLLFGSARRRRQRPRRRRNHQQQQQEQEQEQDDNVNDDDNDYDYGNDNHDDEDDNDNDDTEALWSSLTENVQSLVRVSCRRARWYDRKLSKFTTIGQTEEGQASLMRFVRSATNLKWFRSDLTKDNVAILKQELPPGIVFSSAG